MGPSVTESHGVPDPTYPLSVETGEVVKLVSLDETDRKVKIKSKVKDGVSICTSTKFLSL